VQQPSAGACLVPGQQKKSGAEGHSRTDTGSPPPVFELDAIRTNTSVIEQMKEDAKEKIPALADVEKIKEMETAMVTMANVLANVK